MTATILHGDCLEVLATLPDASVDAVVTDPPYSLGFMGRKWDTHDTPAAFAGWCEAWARECFRVLKPGGHLLAFGGTRTAHRLTCGIEDAGFEIRDAITWLYGSGFPKSLDVSKAIDKAAGATPVVVGIKSSNRPSVVGLPPGGSMGGGNYTERLETAPATDAARQWDGWGTALKPASEPIVVARKPLSGTVAQTVLQHGTGALNIDASRVGTDGGTRGAGVGPQGDVYGDGLNGAFGKPVPGLGRWPANVVLSHAATPDGADLCAEGCVPGCPVADLDAQSGHLPAGGYPGKRNADKFRDAYGDFAGQQNLVARRSDAGGASRFFPTFRYQAKAPARERPRFGDVAHPTVKPLALMRWLVTLVTPPGGTVLDPFAGSGTTVEAALAEGFSCIAIEREADYLPLIAERVTRAGVAA